MVVVFDLDDTLFAEMEYVRSAYREISRRYGWRYFDMMLSAGSPREAFDATGLPVDLQLEIYRTHRPDISLPWQSLYTLATLRNRGCTLGIVTDGRSITQRHKIEALGLDRFVRPDMFFISEEVGADKISGEPFVWIMSKFGESERYIYIGDNPAKDFVAPKRMGWLTVCLLGGADGNNLFSQDFSSFPKENLPEMKIGYLTELLGIVDFENLILK